MTTEERHREREHFAALQRKALEDLGLSPDEVDEAMEPLLSFNLMCDENEAEDAPAPPHVAPEATVEPNPAS